VTAADITSPIQEETDDDDDDAPIMSSSSSSTHHEVAQHHEITTRREGADEVDMTGSVEQTRDDDDDDNDENAHTINGDVDGDVDGVTVQTIRRVHTALVNGDADEAGIMAPPDDHIEPMVSADTTTPGVLVDEDHHRTEVENDVIDDNNGPERNSRAKRRSSYADGGAVSSSSSIASDRSIDTYDTDYFNTTIPSEYLFFSQSGNDTTAAAAARRTFRPSSSSSSPPSSSSTRSSSHRRLDMGTAESDLVTEPIIMRAPTVPMPIRPIQMNYYEDFFDEPVDNYIKHPHRKKNKIVMRTDGAARGMCYCC